MTFTESYNFLPSQVPDQFLVEVFNKINAFVCIIDLQDLRITWANRYLINRTGYSAPFLANITFDELISKIHPYYQELILDKIRNFDEVNKDRYGLFKMKDNNCNWIWILCTAIAYEKSDKGQIKKILVFATDVNIDQLYSQISNVNNSETQPLNMAKTLSARERKVIELISNGNSDRMIAEYLGISIHTAKTHRKRIIRKMGLRNSGALIKYAVENGLHLSHI